MKQPTGNLLTNCISSFLSFLIYYHWCSRAIMAYLVGQYCKDKENNLYPADPQKRAIVDRMLYFDIGTLYKSMVDYFVRTFASSFFLSLLLNQSGFIF